MGENGEWEALDKFLPRMKKMSINRKNILDSNKTAIHYAVQQNQWNIIQKLIEYGSNVNIMDRNHQTPVHLICINKELNDINLFKLFLNEYQYGFNQRDIRGQTLLHLICQNHSNKLSMTDRIKIYIEKHGDSSINHMIADNDGCTPLHYLVEQSNDIEAIELLNVQNIDVVDNHNKTPLIHSVSNNANNPTTIRYLLRNGANINHQDDKGWTPLHFAANHGLSDNVFILLEYFPNITLRNNAGKNPYNLAKSMGHKNIQIP